MTKICDMIEQAIEQAEIGLCEARYIIRRLDHSSATFDYSVTEARDRLQTAAKILDDVRYAQSALVKAEGSTNAG